MLVELKLGDVTKKIPANIIAAQSQGVRSCGGPGTADAGRETSAIICSVPPSLLQHSIYMPPLSLMTSLEL